VNIYGEDAYSRASVFNWVREVDSERETLSDMPRSGRPGFINFAPQIRELLSEFPFHTTRTLAEVLRCHHTTIYRTMQRIGLKYYSLRWVPHLLNPTQLEQRYNTCIGLLSILKKHQKQGWRNIVTEDESWFFLEYASEGVWSASHASTPIMENRKIGSKKYMLTIVWNPYAFYIVNLLPENTSYTAEYLVNTILPELVVNVYNGSRKHGQKRVWLHWDNARPHSAKATQKYCDENDLPRIQHPIYSPDLAPSDFYLLGKIKGRLVGKAIRDENDLLEQIIEILNEIPKDELMSVFNSWIRRVETVIERNGDYYDAAT
jgi:histone-lysine N-methyltransferase SETMAR